MSDEQRHQSHTISDTPRTDIEIKLHAANSELDAIRAVFQHGADEENWKPGTSLAEAVAKLKASAGRELLEEVERLRNNLEISQIEHRIQHEIAQGANNECAETLRENALLHRKVAAAKGMAEALQSNALMGFRVSAPPTRIQFTYKTGGKMSNGPMGCAEARSLILAALAAWEGASK